MRNYYSNSMSSFKAFNEISWTQFEDDRHKSIQQEIDTQSKEYILGIEEEEFVNYLDNKYKLELLEVNKEDSEIGEPIVSKDWIEKEDPWNRGKKHEVDVYNFSIKYKFKGSPILFKVQPSNEYAMTTTQISVNESSRYLIISFKMYKKDPIEFENEKNRKEAQAFTNMERTNRSVLTFNNNLRAHIQSLFQLVKAKYIEENTFFAAINVKVNKDTESVFTVPLVKKINIPQPIVSKKQEFSSEPIMSSIKGCDFTMM